MTTVGSSTALALVPPVTGQPPVETPDPAGSETPARLDDLLDQTVDLLLLRVAELRDHTAADPGRAVADAARLTSAVTQIVRAHHLHAGPAATDAASDAAVLAILMEADAELG